MIIDNLGSYQSPCFQMLLENHTVKFASVQLGSEYNWSKPATPRDNTRTFNVTCQTNPLAGFRSSYNSNFGGSVTGFNISSSMFFLSQGYPKWEGYAIYNDPQVDLLLSKGTELGPTPTPTPSPTARATPNPTTNPTSTPTPTSNPTSNPTTTNPTNKPTTTPTQNPTNNPTTTPNPSPIIPENPTTAYLILLIIATTTTLLLFRKKIKER